MPGVHPVLAFALGFLTFLPMSSAAAQDTVPRFESTACPFETEEELEGVDCGELVVWENRDRPEEGTLRLAVAILRSTAEEPESDPLVFITGGPGTRSVFDTPSRASSDFWSRYRRSRDLVFYDQRGTGYSEPEFCPEMNRLPSLGLLNLPPEEEAARRGEIISSCYEEMVQKGVDFSAYNSTTSALDLDDLRRSLGYERWNLFGLSYGTRLALTALRRRPSGIRSVILDSPAPPSVRARVDAPWKFARSLELVFEQCAADVECSRAFPDPEAAFYDLLDSLDRRPVEITMEDTVRFPQGRLVVDGSLAAGGVRAGLYNRRFIPLLPLLLEEVGLEDRHVWRALADRLVRPREEVSRGLMLSVRCYEDVPFNPPAMLDSARARYPRLQPLYEGQDLNASCRAWHGERADSTFFEPVRSDAPVLILAGEFDPVTPPRYGRQAAETLTNSTVVEVPAHGHSVSPHTGCTHDLLAAFLEDPSRRLDTSCVSEIPPVSFVTDIHMTRGAYPVARRIQEGPDRTVLAAAGLLGLILVSGLVGWPVGTLVRRLRGRSAPEAAGLQRAARWMAALAGLLAIGFAAGLVLAIRETASANPFLLAFGVSGEFGWIFYLPWAVAALTLAALLASVRSWREGWWSVAQRLHYGFVAASCVVFLGAVAYLGLM